MRLKTLSGGRVVLNASLSNRAELVNLLIPMLPVPRFRTLDYYRTSNSEQNPKGILP